jgi:hypothetical protein
MSGWQTVAVNGALADSLVVDLTTQPSPFNGLPQDAELILKINYAASAATQVRLFLAAGAGAAAAAQRIVYDSAFQLNPAANSTQYLTGICVSVPLAPGTNNWMQLRITKAASTANIDWRTKVTMGPGC